MNKLLKISKSFGSDQATNMVTPTTAQIPGERRTLWGKREKAIQLNCYVAKALPVKYQITAHRLCMHGM